MTSRRTSRFRKAFDGLPPEVQLKAEKAFRLFEDDPSHPGLHLKQVHPSRPIYSARIDLDFRALAVREEDIWIWFWIGSHAEYDSLLRRM